MTTTIAEAPPIAFSGSPLDRADHLRNDAEALARHLDHGARLLLLDGLNPVCSDDGALAWGTLADADPEAELVLLGLDPQGRACFAAAPRDASASAAPPHPRLWQVMGVLGTADLAIYGTARALVGWHARHRFCAQCGSATASVRGGWQRDCLSDSCKAQHFPRTDPVSIMLVEHDGDLLLGRQPRFPAGRFSALAGFVEPGETIEEAVAREVWEEAGVRVGAVRYVRSQPWPFPSSLMIGCHAMALSREITIDAHELEEARWFSRAEIAAAMSGMSGAGANFIAPTPTALAWHLLDWWLRQG
jgi:NAD+ diphosphatase